MAVESKVDVKDCARALEAAGLPSSERLAQYMARLLSWNEAINLTGAKSPEEFAVKHVADAWLAAQTLKNVPKQIVDVGSGGGLPGIVLGIFSPQTEVLLVERRQKKAKVLSWILSELGLDKRIKIIPKSFEEIKGLPREAELWFRGFLPGPKLVLYLSQFFPRADLGGLVLMKGPGWTEEKTMLMSEPRAKQSWKERFASSEELSYELPMGAGKRVLVLV